MYNEDTAGRFEPHDRDLRPDLANKTEAVSQIDILDLECFVVQKHDVLLVHKQIRAFERATHGLVDGLVGDPDHIDIIIVVDGQDIDGDSGIFVEKPECPELVAWLEVEEGGEDEGAEVPVDIVLVKGLDTEFVKNDWIVFGEEKEGQRGVEVLGVYVI